MLPRSRIPSHPGIILLEEFLKPLGLPQVAFAAHLGVPVQRINELIRGKRGVTAETAWMLAQALDTTPQFWLNLQSSHDLALARPKKALRRIAIKTAAKAG
jgi:addiction module HigA family antidote